MEEYIKLESYTTEKVNRMTYTLQNSRSGWFDPFFFDLFNINREIDNKAVYIY